MKVFNKRIFRGLKAGWLRYLCRFLLMVLMISVTSGFLVASDSIAKLNDELKDKGKVEDGQITSAYPLSDEAISAMEALDIEVQSMANSNIKLTKNKTLRVYSNRKDINKPTINSGRLPSKPDEIAVNRLYAYNNNIKLGEYINLDSEYFVDGASRRLTVVGLVSLPDYNSAFSKNTDLIFNAINFGIGIISEDLSKELSPAKLHYQTSYRFLDRSLDDNQTKDLNKKILKAAGKDGTVMGYIFKKDNNGINYVKNDMGGDRPMMITLMCLMILLIAFMFGVTIAGKVKEESEIIGILLANGYRKNELLRSYIAAPLIVTFSAAMVGNLIGYTLYVKTFSDIYYTSFDFPNFKAFFNLEALVITTVLPILIILLFNWFFIRNKLKHSPLTFMRKDFNTGLKVSKYSKMPGSFINSFRSRVFMANRGDYLIIVIGVLIISVLFNFGLSAEPTFDNYSKELSKNLISKYQYVLKAPVPASNSSDAEAEEYTIAAGNVYHKLRKSDEDVSLIGIKDNSKYLKDLKLPDRDDEVIISKNMAAKFRFEKGDKVKLKSNILDKSRTYKIVGTYDSSASFALFTRQSFVNKFINKDESFFNGYYADKKLDINENFVATIIDESTVTDVAEQINVSVGPIIDAFVLVAMVFLIAFMYVLTRIITDKNRLQIAYLKVFGYRAGEINKIYMMPATITLIATLILEIPLIQYLTKELTYFSTLKFSGYFTMVTPPGVIIKAISISLGIYALVYLIQMRRISKMSFSEALKNRE